MVGLRKRVCRKVYNILHKEFQKPKELSKNLTLAIEKRVNKLTPYHSKQYLKTFKLIFKKLRVSTTILTSPNLLETRHSGRGLTQYQLVAFGQIR